MARKKQTFDLDTYLGVVAAIVREHGWLSRGKVSRDKADENQVATADRAWQALASGELEPTEADEEAGDAALEHMTTRVEGSTNDFDIKLHEVIESFEVSEKTAGYAAAIVRCHVMDVERNAEREAYSTKWAGSQHQGRRKAQHEFTGTLLSVRELEGKFGFCWLCKFGDDNGNLYSWFADMEPVMERGGRYRISGEVASHREYRGIKETQLKKCSVSTEGN